jgi:hypothetical protein
MIPIKVKGKVRDWLNKNPENVETTVKKTKNFVSITIVTKAGTVIQGQAKDFLYHAMDKEFVVDWLAGGSYLFKIEDVENFMVTQ